MTKYGMGSIYKKDIYGNPLHKCNQEFIKVAKEYYDTHHNNLIKACAESNKDVLLLDIHSFNKEMALIASKEKRIP